MALFAGHEEAHGTHGAPTRSPGELKWIIKTTAETVRKPVTLALWEQHLAGKRPLGVVPIRKNSSCSWGSIDIDEYDVEFLTLIEKIDRDKLPLVPCRSKSGGLHLFLFVTEPVEASEVRGALQNVAAQLGLADSEIFPKQTQVLSDRGDVGNWIVMPYYGDTYGNKLKEQVGVKKTGAEQTLREFLDLAESRRIPPAELAALAVARSVGGRKSGGGKKTTGDGSKPPRGPFSDGPPCLEHLVAGGANLGDGRKRALFMMGVYFKRADPSGWQDKVDEANRLHMKPPLAAEEVTGVTRSLERRDYEYTCKVDPMKDHCHSAKCRTRKFGVGKGGEYPVISGLSKMSIEPAIWFVDVMDTRLMLSSLELQNYQLFHRACMERGNKCFRAMAQKDWLAVLSEAMENVVSVEAPPDAGAEGQFLELLEEFCTNRRRGTKQEDLLRGVPFEDDETGRYYFRLQDFDEHVNRKGVRDLTRGKITQRIRDLGGAHDFFNVKGRGVNVWWVERSRLSQTPQLDVPEIKKSPI